MYKTRYNIYYIQGSVYNIIYVDNVGSWHIFYLSLLLVTATRVMSPLSLEDCCPQSGDFRTCWCHLSSQTGRHCGGLGGMGQPPQGGPALICPVTERSPAGTVSIVVSGSVRLLWIRGWRLSREPQNPKQIQICEPCLISSDLKTLQGAPASSPRRPSCW